MLKKIHKNILKAISKMILGLSFLIIGVLSIPAVIFIILIQIVQGASDRLLNLADKKTSL